MRIISKMVENSFGQLDKFIAERRGVSGKDFTVM